MATLPKSKFEDVPPVDHWAIGKGTKEWVIRQDSCAAMAHTGLRDISHTQAGRLYRLARRKWPFLMFVICARGSGRVHIHEAQWTLRAGEALVIPPGSPHDLEAIEDGWVFSILSYDPASWSGLVPSSPRSLAIHAQSLDAIIAAFHLEYHGDADPVCIRQLTDMIHAKVLRLTNPDQTAGRLWTLWQRVLEEPSTPWTLESLAHLAHMSVEHLRRVSHNEVGHSPMEHVTKLRLQEAARLLISGNDIVEEIAHRVGFESERAFRAAFRRTFDCAPSDYRQRGRERFSALDGQRQAPSAPSAYRTGVDAWTRHVRRWHTLDIARFANVQFSEGENPWMGGDVSFHGIRGGAKKIHGIPFHILNESKGASAIMLKSRHCASDYKGQPLPDRVLIPIQRKARGACFLHACGWAHPNIFASYTFIYQDGGRAGVNLSALGGAHPEEPDGRSANIQDWYFGYDILDRGDTRPFLLPSSTEPSAMPQYLYTLTWHNPRPGAKIDRLEIASVPSLDTTLAVLAISLF